MVLSALILIVTFAYVVLIASFAIGIRRVLNVKANQEVAAVPISVVVAFKDEVLNLPDLLEALAGQSFSKDSFELILVNDHSSDESVLVVERFSSLLPNLRIFNLPDNKSGKKAALAHGIGYAKNSLIAITDADCIPSANWLNSISNQANSGVSLVIGPVVMSPIISFGQKLQALEYSSLMASAAGSCGIGHSIIASSANLAFRNDLLNVSENTLMPEIASGDDMFLLHHAKRIGKGKITFLNVSDAIVCTSSTSSLKGALSQRKRWASKSTSYTDFDTILTGFIVLFFCLMLISLLVASVVWIKWIFWFVGALTIKSLVDYLLLSRYLRFIGQRELMKVFLPLQLIYPFYVVYSFFVGITFKGIWKGKRIK